MSSIKQTVALIGLGSMGKTLGHAMLKAEVKLTVWNRTPSRPTISELVSAGAEFEMNISKAILSSNTVIFCVLDYSAIKKIIDPISASNVFCGRNVVNLTNGTPQEARNMNDKMKGIGVVKYIDGGIMVPPQAIGTPGSFIFCSGETETLFEPFKTLIQTMGIPHYLGEDPGAAALYDLALLAGMYGMFGGLFTAIGMMKKQRLRIGEAGPVKVEHPVKEFLNPLLQMLLASQAYTAKAVDEGNFGDNHGHPMAMMSVSMDNILKTCDDEGVDSQCMKPFDYLMKKAIEKGGPDCGLAQISVLMSK